MGKNLPYATGLATALIAANPHGYWRRDPESNRARRICNPASGQGKPYVSEGKTFAPASWRAGFASSCPKNYLIDLRLHRPVSVAPIHAGFDPSGYSNDRPIRAVSPLWRGRSSSNV